MSASTGEGRHCRGRYRVWVKFDGLEAVEGPSGGLMGTPAEYNLDGLSTTPRQNKSTRQFQRSTVNNGTDTSSKRPIQS
jgi:hypothetical protein